MLHPPIQRLPTPTYQKAVLSYEVLIELRVRSGCRVVPQLVDGRGNIVDENR